MRVSNMISVWVALLYKKQSSICSGTNIFVFDCSIYQGEGLRVLYILMIKKQAIPVLLLNVNCLGNPIKRSKIMSKLNKERTLISFQQEAHLSDADH